MDWLPLSCRRPLETPPDVIRGTFYPTLMQIEPVRHDTGGQSDRILISLTAGRDFRKHPCRDDPVYTLNRWVR